MTDARDPHPPLHRSRRLPWLMGGALALLSACGGGGGGGSAPPVSGPVTISGVAQFDSVPNDRAANGRLNYGATTARPIRGATVQVLAASGGAVLASGTTSASGGYTLDIATAQPVIVRVRAELRRSGATGGQYDYRVLDNTNGNALYVLDSPAFTPASSAETRNLRAASGWGGSSYTTARAAAPFAILDVAWQTTQKVLTASPNASFAALRMFWSVNNRPVFGNPALGEIGTSFYQLNGGHTLYLLGAAGTDTDEYDAHVVAHEWGHYFQSAFSRDDSIGGNHGLSDRLDMRVAFSEGWGNAWSGMALADPRYADSLGPGQAQGFVIDVSDAPAGNRGWYSEGSVQYLLWNFHQDAGIGFAPIFSVMRGPLTTSGALTSIHNFGQQLKAAVPAQAAIIDGLGVTQDIALTDAFGSGETNDGGITGAAAVLPIYKTHGAALGVAQNYCMTASADPGDEGNKLGQYVYTRVTLASGGTRTITLTSTNGGAQTDPDFRILRADGSRFAAESAALNSESASTSLGAGTHVFVLNDFTLTGSNLTRCFDLTVQ